jgi:hypothetical protein
MIRQAFSATAGWREKIEFMYTSCLQLFLVGRVALKSSIPSLRLSACLVRYSERDNVQRKNRKNQKMMRAASATARAAFGRPPLLQTTRAQADKLIEKLNVLESSLSYNRQSWLVAVRRRSWLSAPAISLSYYKSFFFA